MDSEFDRIRHKVEQGAVLTEAELARLERAAAADPTPTCRVALAQAWINADQERRAVELLERLRQDFPRDVQVHLGHARALFALDRFDQAEAAVKRALAVNPGDLEAEKSLAIIALRRGEFARARKTLAEVLQRDPFDQEAQLLQAELSGADLPEPLPQPRQVPLLPEFTEALIAALQTRGHRSVVRGAELIVELGQRLARVDLPSLYAGFLDEGTALDEAAAGLAEQLTRPADAIDARSLEHVLPVLREKGFSARAKGNVQRRGPAGLELFYAFEDPELVRYVPEAVLDSVTVGELHDEALANLAQRCVDPAPVELEGGELRIAKSPTGLWALAAGDGHDAARLLVFEQRVKLEERVGPAPWKVSLGSRAWALIARAEDAPAVRALSQVPVTDGIDGTFEIAPDGTWTQPAPTPPGRASTK